MQTTCEMFQYPITTPIIEDDGATKNIICKVFLNHLIIYFPHMFEILN